MIYQVNLSLEGEVVADDYISATEIINKYVDSIADIDSGTFHYPNIEIEYIADRNNGDYDN